MLASARADRFKTHTIVDDPQDAELILFVETGVFAGHYFEYVRRHPLFRSRREDCYLFCSTDKFIPLLPGVYASVERPWYWPSWTRSGHYVNIGETDRLHFDPREHERKYLYSFVGSTQSHAVRRRLMSVQHPDALLIDTLAAPGEVAHVPRETYERRYLDSVLHSAFILCPRGGGTSSFRLFETMMMGRAPVVISDAWVPPWGPDWDNISIRIREAEIDTIPDVLQSRASEARGMGETARQAWLDWFSEPVSFHRVVEACLELRDMAPARGGLRRYTPYLQFLRPFHAARWTAKRLGHKGNT